MFDLRTLLTIGFVLYLLQAPVMAGEDWGLCHTPSYRWVNDESDGSEATNVTAQQLFRDSNRLLLFSGEVVLKQRDKVIRADEIRYDTLTEAFSANGSVTYEKPNFRLTAEQFYFDRANDQDTLIKPGFEISSRHGRGEANQVNILDESLSRFSNVLYTTCDPGERGWHFTSDELEINNQSGLGSAYHTLLYFQNMPIFYFPYFQFPIDDRRISGVLAPDLSFSSSGNHLAVPVYWNIAPDFDMTFTPTWYEHRGLLYSSENRYLFEHNRGQIDYRYLHDDREDDTRWFKKWQHTSSYPAYSLMGRLLLQAVSDDDFFTDFDRSEPGKEELDHLDRRVQFAHTGKNWKTTLMWQDYQTIDSTIALSSRPYQQLPHITINSTFKRQKNGFQFNIQNELVRFKRASSINGSRIHLVPTLNWQSLDSWYFLQPQLQYAFTDYALDNNSTGDDHIRRSLPIASLDSGLIFERTGGMDNNWLQTLEPRLYFLHVPFEEQDHIPDFDSSLLSESYENLFRPNRFSGIDRIGDASQVTFGLGTRLYHQANGRQLLHTRIARTFYVEDRHVSLNGATENKKRSNIIAQININPNPNLAINSELTYDQSINEYSKRRLSVNWSKEGIVANFGYYFDHEKLEQSRLSIVYPMTDNWTVIAKHHQSLLFDIPVEKSLGLIYESCCWGLKILASEVSDDDFEEIDKALYLELTLKGLSQVGHNIEDRLRRNIPGY